MFGQDQEQSVKWRRLMLPLLLPILVMLLLLYLLPAGMAAKTSAFPPAYLALDLSHFQDCDLALRNKSSQQTVAPGGSASYKLIADNVGNFAGTLILNATSLRGWAVSLNPSSSIALPVKGSYVITVRHTAPIHASPGSTDVVLVTGQLACPLSCGGQDTETVTLTTTVEADCTVELEPDRSVSAVAGETVYLTHTLSHNSDATETFRFEATSTLGWAVTPPATVQVRPEHPVVVTTTVAVPLAADRGQVDSVVVTAISVGHDNVFTHTTNWIQVIQSGCEVVLNVREPGLQSAAPGESVTYTLAVSNVGVCAGNVGMEIDAPEGWAFAVIPPPTTTLLPAESSDWQLRLSVPLFEQPADKTTNITAVLDCTAIHKVSKSPGYVRTTVLATPIAIIEPDITIGVMVTADVFNNGIDVSFVHIVTNVGNLTDTFDFDAHSAQGWLVEKPASANWDVGESKQVVFSVAVPPHTSLISDTLVVTATPRSAPDYFDTAVDFLRGSCVHLPIIPKNFNALPLCNGNFDTGNLICWSYSRYGRPNELPVTIVPAPGGGYRALLGNPDYYCDGGVETGRAWLTQTFKVPDYGQPQLAFYYEVHTQDEETYDSFDVYLNQHLILKVGYGGNNYGCENPIHIVSDKFTIDLANPKDWMGNSIDADFLGSEVTLRFENWNRFDNWYNTWTYVDDVEFTW